MKRICHVITACLLLICSACEATLPLDELSQQETEGLVVNALLNPDTAFCAHVSRAYLYTDKPMFPSYTKKDVREFFEEEYYSLYSEAWGGIDDIEDSIYYTLPVLSDAEVTVQVNGQESFLMQYDSVKHCYTSSYVPRAGDRVRLQVNGMNGQESVATAEVPRAQRLEIKGMEWEKRPLHFDYDPGTLAKYSGYVVKFTLSLTDPSEEKNYYRLKIRGIADASFLIKDEYLAVNDYYMSDDLIFRDDRLTTGWSGWDAYFSDVFEDRLFDGETYTFEVEAYAFAVSQSYFMLPNYIIELQSISEDYYRYLKSMMLYRISSSDSFSEGIYIHSNNKGGWGVLGAMHGEEHVLHWDKEKQTWDY